MSLEQFIAEKIRANGVAKTAKALGMGKAELEAMWQEADPIAHNLTSDILPLPDKSVCLMLPWYKWVNPKTAFCVLALLMRNRQLCRIQERDGDAMITRSRNHLARRFIRDTQCEWSLWLDDDMIFPIAAAGWFNQTTGMNLPDEFAGSDTLQRMLGWGKSIVGAVYYDRHGKGTLTAGYDRFIPVKLPHNGIFPVKFIGTGCLLVHRQVYLDIAKMFPEVMPEDAMGNESGFFTNIQGEKRMMGEDESFGWRAVQAGHQSFLDLGLICGHAGTQVFGLPKNR